jgi:hypothetical protein
MIALSLSLVLGGSSLPHLFAQGDAKKDGPAADSKSKKDEAPKTDAAKTDAPKGDAAKGDAAKSADTKSAAEAPLPEIPADVKAKLEAARKAVAEAIVAAQDAGLVESTIDPPPILDILITGRAIDARTLKARKGASPEVFAAWYTGYGKASSGMKATEVKITNPSEGLKTFFDERAAILNQYIDAIRKAKGTPAKPADAKKEEPKKEEPKKEEPKKEEPKKEEPKKEDAKKK